jgi:hypothetical protein
MRASRGRSRYVDAWKERIVIDTSRLYLITNAQMVPLEQRHVLYAELNSTTLCFGAFRTPEAVVVALLATEQAMAHLQDQFRVLEFEVGMTEQHYLVELYQSDEIIPLKKEP